MAKQVVLCFVVGIGLFVAAAQLYIIAVCIRCVPYSTWVVVGLDAVSVLGWVATVAVLAYWNVDVLYTSRAGDAAAWRKCYEAPNGYAVYDGATDGGTALYMVWWEVEVD
ncbi:hypothetical protein LEL_07792 [Akanthomyces lecanii RCEF 1005]|uniref:Uncharacterized protein n=1 Tax=Akanthomyces lecanii RCEF 1005 TaxID=1081108 RepID=A0A168FZ33_CORDF|nr:hypothetical protein LEL_07792 [Akanthomyces lecanii RCEF 1005]